MGVNATTFVPAYVAGEILTAADLSVTNSGIPVFATTTTRDAAFGGTGEKVLAEGQLAYIEATKTTQFYNGSAWKDIVTDSWTLYTPTITAFSGTFTSVSGSGYYVRSGNLVVATINITITTNGTASNAVAFTLPFTADTSVTVGGGIGSGREGNITGNMLNIWRTSSGAAFANTNNSYPGGNGYLLSGTYSYQAV